MKPRSLAGIVPIVLQRGGARILVGRLPLPSGGHTCPDRRLPDSGRLSCSFTPPRSEARAADRPRESAILETIETCRNAYDR